MTLQKLFRQPKVTNARFQGRQRIDGNIPAVQRIVAPEAVGQANRLLAVDRFIHARRIEVRIAQAVVDRAQSRAAGIARERHLHRGGLAGEDQQAVVGRVQRQVHQDVDPVLADLLGHLLVGEADDVAPAIGVLLKLAGHRIGTEHLGIADDLELPAIVLLEQRQEISADDVVSEIRRDIADPQAPVGAAVVGMGLNELPQRLGMLAVPAAMFLGDGLGVVSGMKVQGVDEIAVGVRRSRD